MDEVGRAILELDDKTHAGLMNIEVKFLKHNTDTVTPVIHNICNAIIETGQVPNS